jgi:hypothetical protein
MSMSTHVVAIVPPDEQREKMKAVYDACKSAKVSLPDEVADYFDGERLDAYGAALNIDGHEAVEEWKGDMESGFQVDLSKLPNHVKFIRFYNSY